MNNITVNLENLTAEERTMYAKLTKKASESKITFTRKISGDRYYKINEVYNTEVTYDARDKYDDYNYEAHNYHLTKEHAQRVADHLKKSRWLINASMLFAAGEEVGGQRYYLLYDKQNERWTIFNYMNLTSPTDIYMTNEQAEQFKEWLTKFAPQGELI